MTQPNRTDSFLLAGFCYGKSIILTCVSAIVLIAEWDFLRKFVLI